MNIPTFRETIDAAVEAREPLDTPAFAALAASADPAERDYWCSQVRLDAVINRWVPRSEAPRSRSVRAKTFGTKRLFPVRLPHAASALALALGLVVLWTSRSPVPSEPVASAVPVITIIPVAPAEPPVVARESLPEADSSPAFVLADASSPADGFTQASQTAERLAYAFQPVGDQVGSVVRLLIDAVPGSDIFSM